MSEEEEEYEIIFDADDAFLGEIQNLKFEVEKQGEALNNLIKEILDLKKIIKQ